MGSLIGMGNVSGGSFTESIAGKRLVASKTIKAIAGALQREGNGNYSYNYYSMTGESFTHNGGGIASVKLLNKGNSNNVTIKVDNVQLTDFSHFVDYRRGYAYGFGYGTLVISSTGSYNQYGAFTQISGSPTAHTVNECHFDFLTIPFLEGFEIKIDDYTYYTYHYNYYDSPQDRTAEFQRAYNYSFSASIAVWENDD